MPLLRIAWWLIRSRLLRRILIRLAKLIGVRRAVRALFRLSRRARVVARLRARVPI